MKKQIIKNVLEVKEDTKVCSRLYKKGTFLLQTSSPDDNDHITIVDNDGNTFSLNMMDIAENQKLLIHSSPKREEFNVGETVYYIHEDQVYCGELLEIVDNQCVISLEEFKWKVNPETVAINKALVASENDVCTFKNDGNGCFFSYSIPDSPTHKVVYLWDGVSSVFA
jgi:hypothetical protein